MYNIFNFCFQDEDDDNFFKYIGDSNDGVFLQFVFEMGEIYQIWRDEYFEDMFVYRCVSFREVFLSFQYIVVVIYMRDSGSGGYKLYCKGVFGYVLFCCI